MKKIDELNLAERLTAPTPSFFKKLMRIGLILSATGGAILAAPVSLPAVVITVAGYVAVAGGVLAAISQVTVDEAAFKKQTKQVTRRQ